MTIRVALADDHRMLRETLRVILAAEADLEVVGQASTGAETLAMVLETPPEVLLLDIAFPDMNGIEVARQIRVLQPKVKVIALTGYADRLFIQEMLKAGAHGYIVKADGADDLLKGIRSVMAGQDYISPEAARVLLRGLTPGEASAPPPSTVLTPREREVLGLVAAGHRASRIAEELGIAAATVDVHRRNLKRKLGLATSAELVRYAIREGIV
jgi:two-component system NarL family response regulator